MGNRGTKSAAKPPKDERPNTEVIYRRGDFGSDERPNRKEISRRGDFGSNERPYREEIYRIGDFGSENDIVAGVPVPPKTVRLTSPKENALLVVAIDFGTTYSGYGYSFKAEKGIFLTNYWDGANLKTPTEVLLGPDKTLHSFGQRARKEFEELIKNGQHNNWYFFSRFKMKLFVRDGSLDLNMKLVDIGGKEMLAVDVFTAAIKFMVKHCKTVLNERESHVKINVDKDIHWVLTVPAIWDDLSKCFMRTAATRAGIPDNLLSLSLEPEAASLFCKSHFNDITMISGTRYLVLDLGGGTADIICHEVEENGKLKELHRATGGDFGGTSVDNKFMETLNRIFGAPTVQEFKKRYMDEYWELIQEFERKKRYFDGSDRIVFPFPIRLIEMHENNAQATVTETLLDSPMKGRIEFKQGKVFITRELAKELFDTAVDKIYKAAQEIVQKINDIQYIVLAGGFSESPYIQKIMKQKFPSLIKIPKEPAGAVVKGAVIYGHESKAISSRVCKYTYDIARMLVFKEGLHPEGRRIRVGDLFYCDNIFNKHIEIGETIAVGSGDQIKAHKYYPSTGKMRQAVLEVFASTEKNPKFIDEPGCTFVGLIKVEINPQGDIWAKLNVKLIFGGTELIVEVHDVKSNRTTQGTVEFFG